MMSFLNLAAAVAAVDMDLFWLQDFSDSSTMIMDQMYGLLDSVMKVLLANGDNSRLGFASFIDKPMADFGDAYTDYCYKRYFPLSDVYKDANGNVFMTHGETNEEISLNYVTDNMYAGSGLDFAEDQLSAIIHTLLSPNSGWDDSRNATKIVVLVTDSYYHDFGDGSLSGVLKRPDDGASAYAEEPENWCMTATYPTLADVHMAFEHTDAVMIVLTTEALEEYWNEAIDAIQYDKGYVMPWDNNSLLNRGANGFVRALYAALEAMLIDQSFAEAGKTAVKEMITEDAHTMSRTAHSPSQLDPEIVFGSGEDLPSCPADIVFEVVVAQDASQGWDEPLAALATEFADSLTELLDIYPGSRVAVSSFVDKPIHPFGYGAESSNDYCAVMRTTLSDDVPNFKSSYESITIRSGNDIPEAQLHALVQPQISSRTRFTHSAIDEEGRRVVRVVVVVTDSPYHEAGDAAAAGVIFPPYTPAGGAHSCSAMDYPSVQQVSDVLVEGMYFPMFLVPHDMVGTYEHLLDRLHLNGYVGTIDRFGPAVTGVKQGLFRGLEAICNYGSLLHKHEDGHHNEVIMEVQLGPGEGIVYVLADEA